MSPSRSRDDGIIPALAGNTFFFWTGAAIPQDHPRSRGEYSQGLSGLHQRGGSSPLSRGIRRAASDVCSGLRIIPALAGNTNSF